METYDPEGAKKLLAKVGLGDGFRLTIHGPNDRYVNDAKILEALAQMFTRIGIVTEVVAQPMAAFQARASRLEYSVPMTGSASGTGESSSSLKNNLHSFNKEGGYGAVNRGRWVLVRSGGGHAARLPGEVLSFHARSRRGVRRRNSGAWRGTLPRGRRA